MHSYRADKDESATERVLRALDAAQPAAGFEDRLLQKLAQRPQENQHTTRRVGFAMGGVLAGAGGAVAILVVLLAVHLRPKHSDSPVPTEAVPPLASLSAPVTAAQPKALPTMQGRATPPRPAHSPASSALIVHARLEVSSSTEPAGNDGTNGIADARALDRQAMDDLRAASSPPPPLPPTAQERLVKLMLRRGEKHDLAQLDPAQSMRRTDAEQRSFQTFFDPDPSPELALELKKGNYR